MYLKFYGLALAILFAFTLSAQPPANYYSTATGSGYTLKTQLHNIIKNHTVISYGNLYAAYQGTLSSAPATDKKPNGKVWDMYSDIPNGTPPYEFNWNQTCGNYSQEGDCFNREHSFPQSWFSSASPMQSDLFHVYPTDGKVNNIRSNFPFGETSNPTQTTRNGSKLGPCSFPGYTGTVFEPRDEYKGDLARTYFYMATRYENLIANWQNNSNADNVLNGTSTQVFDTWHLNLLWKWHQQDPVSQKEIDRNNAVFALQGNRNPYIDNPQWVGNVWGLTPAAPAVNFANATGTIQEPTSGTRTYTINVVTNTTSRNPFTVTIGINTTNTTAQSPANYTFNTTSITFSGTETIKSVQVTINHNPATEPDRTLELVLSNPTNSMGLGSPATHLLTIRDANAPTANIETFDPCTNLNTWRAFSVVGAQVWACTTNGFNGTSGAQMNGFASQAVANEDWLISPAQNITASSKISYKSRADFAGPMLELFVSDNYTGTGSPTNATWTKVTAATFATPSGNANGTWVTTSNVDLAAFAGNNRHIAFKYTSTTGTNAAARWTLDDLEITGTTAPVVPTPTLSSVGSLTNFGNITNNQVSAIQTLQISGQNLSANVVVEAPTNFEVSRDGINFANTITYTAGTDFALPTFSLRTFHIRFAPKSGVDGTKSADLTISSTGASPIFVNVEGTETGNTTYSVQFNATTGSTTAKADQAVIYEIPVSISPNPLENIAVQVNLDNTNTTALPSEYAFSNPTTLTFSPNQTTLNAIIVVQPAQSNIAGKQVRINLSAGTRYSLGANTSHTLTIGFATPPTALEDFEKNIRIFPTYVQNELHIQNRYNINISKVQIWDLRGNILYQKATNSSNLSIPMTNFVSGTYILTLQVGNKTISKQVVVIR